MSLIRNCGRLTANPIAVRLAAALNPVNPKSVTSIDGMACDDGSLAVVFESNRDQAIRASFDNLLLKILFKTIVAALFSLEQTLSIPPV